MTDIDTLVDILWAAFESEETAYVDREMDVIDAPCGYESFTMRRIAERVLAALDESRTIRTVEQLDALPEQSVIRDTGGRVFEKTDDWACSNKRWTSWWSEPGEEGEASSDELDDLPALLLYSPTRE